LHARVCYFKLKRFPVYVQFDGERSAFKWRRRRYLKLVRSMGDKLSGSSWGIGRTNGAD